MVLFEWNDKYSVGIDKFDTQHKRLIELINNLHDGMKEGKGKETLGAILQELLAYTKFHFGEEEKLMQITNYQDFEKHKVAHDQFTSKVENFINDYSAGNSFLALEVMNFLKDWLITHIQGIDKLYTSHFQTHEVNKA